jgi:Tol biopolymer transport system component
MDTSRTPAAAIAALAAILVPVAVGCGAGAVTTTGTTARQGTSTASPPQTCDNQRPILYLGGASRANGRPVPSARTTGGGATWSPDGGTEAYVSADAHRVILRSVGGGERTLFVTPHKITLVHRVSWSPDGQRLALLVLDARGLGSQNSLMPADVPHVVVIDVGSGRPVRDVALSPRVVNMPFLTNPPDAFAFSPDGSRVLISWDSLAVVDVARGQVHQVWPRPAVAGWSPQGQVLFLDVVARKRFGALRAWAPGSGPRVVWNGRALEAAGIVAEHGIEYGQLRVSPDGSRLALRTTDGAQTAIDVFRLAGSAPGAKVGSYPATGAIWDFDWSPDSRCIAAVVLDQPRLDVQVLNLAAGTWKPVGRLPVKVESWDTLEALAPIRKLTWNG